MGVGDSDEIHEDVVLHDAGLQARLGDRASGTPAQQHLTWQWSPRGKLCGPGLGRWWMQEWGPQLGLPQALVWRGQQRRSPWWLEVVEGGLGWGHPGLRRWRVEEEASQLGVGPRVLRPKDGSRRGWARSCSRRALGGTWGGLGSTLGLGLPRGPRGPYSTLRLGLRWAELEQIL